MSTSDRIEFVKRQPQTVASSGYFRKAVLLCSFVSSLSCQKDLTVDLPAYEPKIVVEGYLTAGDSVIVRVNQTRPFNLQYSISDPNSDGSNANVVVNVNGTDYTLQQYTFTPSGVLPYPTLYGLPPSLLVVPSNGIISIRVNYKGMTANSQSTILPPTKIISFQTIRNKSNSSILDVIMEASFPIGPSYYLIQVTTKVTIAGSPVTLNVLSDVILVDGDGNTKKVLVENRLRGFVATPSTAQRYLITLKRVQKEFYDFDIALRVQLDDLNGGKKLLGRDLVEIPSNINGGVGMFTAMSPDTLSLYQ